MTDVVKLPTEETPLVSDADVEATWAWMSYFYQCIYPKRDMNLLTEFMIWLISGCRFPWKITNPELPHYNLGGALVADLLYATQQEMARLSIESLDRQKKDYEDFLRRIGVGGVTSK